MKKFLCVFLAFLLLSSFFVFTSLADGSVEYVVAFGDVSTADYSAYVEWLDPNTNTATGFDMYRDGNTFYSPSGVNVAGAPNYVNIHLKFKDSYTFGAGAYTLKYEIWVQYREDSQINDEEFLGCKAVLSDGTVIKFENVEKERSGEYWIYYVFSEPFSVSLPARLVTAEYLYGYSKPQWGGGYTCTVVDPLILGYTDSPANVPSFEKPSIDGFDDYESANDAMDSWIDDNKNITEDLIGFDITAVPDLAFSLGFISYILEKFVFSLSPITLILRLSIAVGLVGVLFNLAAHSFSRFAGSSAAHERSGARSDERGKR